RTFFALALASLAAGAWADSYQEAYALRSECTAKYYGAASKADYRPEYSYSHTKGEYKGEYRDGKLVSCTDEQYTAYLETVDPTRVMYAYPTAAGRPPAATKALNRAKKSTLKDTTKPSK
ncbi:MAG TPA: hypothetical protein VGE47_10125, partial [Burkholderiaceae bacterium]